MTITSDFSRCAAPLISLCIYVLKLNFWILRFCIPVSLFFCLFVCRLFVCHHGAELWRLWPHCSRLLCAGKWCGWVFIMENGRLALNQRESIHFGDFRQHMKMILHIWALQRPFSKPMVQSVALVFVEKVKKKALQGHCPLSSSIVHRPNENHLGARACSYQNLNARFWMLRDTCNPHRLLLAQPTHSACQQEALPAKV